MERKEYFMSKGKASLSVVALLVLAAGMAVLEYLTFEKGWAFPFGQWFWIFTFAFAALAFAATGVWMFTRMGNKKPMLIIEEDGFVDNIGVLKGHKYLFSQLESFEVKTMMGNKMILPIMKDPEGFIEERTGMKKKLMKSAYHQNGSPISLPVRGLDTPFDEILNELVSRHEKAVKAVAE